MKSIVETVLVLERHAGIRELLEVLLVRDGYRVISAASGAGALSRARQDRPVDLLIAELDLPDLRDDVVAACLGSRFRDVPAVILTDLPLQAEATNAFVILRKPFTVAQLRQAIRCALGERMGQEDAHQFSAQGAAA